MKLDDIEQELHNALESENSIQGDLASVFLMNHGIRLIAVVKAAKNLPQYQAHHEDLKNALAELEKE